MPAQVLNQRRKQRCLLRRTYPRLLPKAVLGTRRRRLSVFFIIFSRPMFMPAILKYFLIFSHNLTGMQKTLRSKIAILQAQISQTEDLLATTLAKLRCSLQLPVSILRSLPHSSLTHKEIPASYHPPKTHLQSSNATSACCTNIMRSKISDRV